MSNQGLRRVVAAYAGFNFGEWATWIAILVYAYDRGGATEAGIVALIQLIPASIVAPMAAGLADRYPRERALLAGYVAQAVTMGATAVALVADAPSPVVYLFAAATATSVTLTRPAHGSILPSLALTPAELTAANVASGTVQNLCILIAPAVAGLLLQAQGAASVFIVTAAGVTLSTLLVAGVRTSVQSFEADMPEAEPVLSELAGGFATLRRLSGPRTIVALIAAGGMIEGALDVFIVVLALDVLRIGDAGVGFLNSAIGAGGLIGAAMAVALVGRMRLARPFATGLLLWGLPMAAVGLLPAPAVALALFVAAGAGRALMDVAGRTLLQRATPDDALARVFGVLEGLHMGMLGLGSIAVPALIGLTGPRQALILAGLWIPLVLVVAWRALRAVDAAAVVHVRELELLRGIPTFAVLSPPTIERLSARLAPVTVSAGYWVIRQGETGDRYYIVDRGEAEVFIDDRLVRTEGPGDGFGEIALVRNIPRTASVRATTDLALLALDRDVFLAAVAGHRESRKAMTDVVADRLGAPSN
jgi:MFS family permease